MSKDVHETERSEPSRRDIILAAGTAIGGLAVGTKVMTGRARAESGVSPNSAAGVELSWLPDDSRNSSCPFC